MVFILLRNLTLLIIKVGIILWGDNKLMLQFFVSIIVNQVYSDNVILLMYRFDLIDFDKIDDRKG